VKKKKQIIKDGRFDKFYENIKNKRIYSRLIKPDKPLELLEPLIITGPFKNERPYYHGSFIEEMIKLGYFKYGGYDPYYRLNGIQVHFGDRYKGRKEIALCANKITKYGIPWIYFPKYYKKFFEYKKIIKANKTDCVCWIGASHRARKNISLAKYCDFNYNSRSDPLPYYKYLQLLASHNFCLCYPGFGPKCHREIEAMGLGTIPVITEGVCTNYHNKLIENIHFIKVKTAKDIKSLKQITKSQRLKMSNSCLTWFNENISPLNAYRITTKCIQEIKSR
jgi:hypothetical protein